MGFDVRPVTERDAAAAGIATADAYREFSAGLDACQSEMYADYLVEIADVAGRMERTLVLGAFDGEEPVGTVTLEIDGRIRAQDPAPHPDEIHIRMLGVSPGARGRGAGRALMDATFAEARRRGRHHITLHTTAVMHTAREMYERMGFTRISESVTPIGTQLFAYEMYIAATAPQ